MELSKCFNYIFHAEISVWKKFGELKTWILSPDFMVGVTSRTGRCVTWHTHLTTKPHTLNTTVTERALKFIKLVG